MSQGWWCMDARTLQQMDVHDVPLICLGPEGLRASPVKAPIVRRAGAGFSAKEIAELAELGSVVRTMPGASIEVRRRLHGERERRRAERRLRRGVWSMFWMLAATAICAACCRLLSSGMF